MLLLLFCLFIIIFAFHIFTRISTPIDQRVVAAKVYHFPMLIFRERRIQQSSARAADLCVLSFSSIQVKRIQFVANKIDSKEASWYNIRLEFGLKRTSVDIAPLE